MALRKYNGEATAQLEERISRKRLSGVLRNQTELKRKYKDDKLSVLDVRVETAKGTDIAVEIQVAPDKTVAKRALHCWSEMFATHLKKGNHTKNNQKQYPSVNRIALETDFYLHKLEISLYLKFLFPPAMTKKRSIWREAQIIYRRLRSNLLSLARLPAYFDKISSFFNWRNVLKPILYK